MNKYQLGDEVWALEPAREDVFEECPDCLGEKAWQVLLPGQPVIAFLPCPTCVEGYDPPTGRIRRTRITLRLRSLTIMQVRVEQTWERTECRYMCRETGVGTGTLWEEKYLYASYQEAMAALPAKQAAFQAQEDEITLRNLDIRRKSHTALTTFARAQARVREAKKQLALAEKVLATCVAREEE